MRWSSSKQSSSPQYHARWFSSTREACSRQRDTVLMLDAPQCNTDGIGTLAYSPMSNWPNLRHRLAVPGRRGDKLPGSLRKHQQKTGQSSSELPARIAANTAVIDTSRRNRSWFAKVRRWTVERICRTASMEHVQRRSEGHAGSSTSTRSRPLLETCHGSENSWQQRSGPPSADPKH